MNLPGNKMLLPGSNMLLLDRLAQARLLDREQHREQAQRKLGVLRAGNSGILTESGDMAGSCMRRAHLRTLGLEIEEVTTPTYIMWELGYANEDVVATHLAAVLGPDEVMLREEEIPVEWRTSNGTLVTGRPDIVLCHTGSPTPIPYLGLELKSVHSMWVARDVLLEGKPKLAHVIQAAHYKWRLSLQYDTDIAWKVMYKGYSQLGQGLAGAKDGDRNWIMRLLPRAGEPGSEYLEYNDKGQIKHMRQFEVAYDIEIDEHGRVYYRNEANDGDWHQTIVTIPDLERYYEWCSQIPVTGILGPRPLTLDVAGKKLSYSECNYCPLDQICDTVGRKGTYEQWIQLVQEHAAALSLLADAGTGIAGE